MKLGRQYAAKLAANAVSALAGMVLLGLVPRALGPEGYGRYEFLANFFQQVKSFLDMGTSICFYTKLSQRGVDTGLVAFYRRLLLGASALMLCGAWLLAGTPAGNWMWAGEGTLPVLLAAAFALATWWLDTTRKMVDAWQLTVRGEALYALSRIAAVLLLASAVWGWGLRVEGYFVYQIAAALLAMLMLTPLLRRHSRSANTPVAAQPARAYLREFWAYSHPLVAYASVGVLAGLADRWILQTQAGAIEQGYFGLASQVGAVCFLFTSAMTQLLTREFATAWDQNDMARMRAMFRRVIPMLYAVAAYFSVFVACHAEDVVRLFGGKGWEPGMAAMAIMVLYPMHQTYGQLSGSVFYATGQTRLYRNIGIVGALAGLPLMFWLLASVDNGGLGLGAVGLALKTVAMQFVMVNVQLWFNTRLLALGFWKFVAHQLIVPAAFLACVLASTALMSPLGLPWLWQFLLTGAGYTVLAAGMVLLAPRLAGLRQGEIGAMLRGISRSGT